MIDTMDKEYKKLQSQFTIYNDLWTAKQFAESCVGEIAYCANLGGWFVWAGSRWKRDEINHVQKLLIDKLIYFRKMAIAEQDAFLIKHIKQTGTSSKIASILKLVSSHPQIVRIPEDFDIHKHYFNTATGTLDINTRQIHPHTSLDDITKLSLIKYSPDETCPNWIHFLNTIFEDNKELVDFIQRMMGYSLLEENPEQAMFILYGGGQNGKSTFLQVLRRILGDYTLHAQIDTFMSKHNKGPSNDIARLKGARLVTAAESARNHTLDESLIKELTGGEPITARFLHKEFFSFDPNFKICMITNHKPNITGTDEGIWRRIMLVPFNYTIPKEKRIHKYEDILFEELSGILNWALDGYQNWQKEKLNAPLSVLDAVNDYRDEEDLLAVFIEEACTLSFNGECRVHDMRKTFHLWCKNNGYRFFRYKNIAEYLQQKSIFKEKITVGKHRLQWCWRGISIKNEFINTSEEVTDDYPF